jgi:hypothetical protein
MNSHLLAELARQRRREIHADFARGEAVAPSVRPLVGRALRATGDRLFRWGVALDERVNPIACVEASRR